MRHCLSCYVSLPSASNLEARLEGGFGVLDVLALLVLEPEEAVLCPVLSFLFVAFWAGGLGCVWPLSFALSWLAGALLARVSLAASDRRSQ